ncbi:MAG TPA: PQQ-binding-like beta-propeller repeat protein [Solirubrobacterales bacterium]|nr:PQQ-binding-like beta-propeller repeat protein [Solirubrobacterales bacterium]
MSKLSKFRGSALLALALALGALGAGCGSSSSSSEHNLSGDAYPNIDLQGSRQAKGSIDASNVSQLKEAWSVPIEGTGVYGSYAWAPVEVNGVIYSQDLESNVSALDLENGETIWSTKFESPSHGPNGLSVGQGRVYGTTASAAFAVDQKTGKKLWETPLNGAVDIAPATARGMVFVATVPETPNAEYEAGLVGTLYALDAKTGKQLWEFATVPKNLWGDPGVNSGGGLWYPPSFDEEGNLYAGTGNPAPLPGTPNKPWGSSRPGDNHYADSLVKLNEKTGKVEWYYQQTPHNIYDWDFQNTPVIATVGGRKLAIGSGKSGWVVAVDAKTGKPVWKTSVGVHNGHDNDPLYAMRGEYSKIKPGEVFPGELGGVIAPIASDGKTLYVPVVNHSMTVRSGSEISEESAATGEVVAIDIKTGKIKWKRELEQPAYGATIVVNDLVFATTADGVIHALKTGTGGEVWQAALPAGTNAGVMVSGDMLLAPAGLPLAEGQKAMLVAYKLGG